jgi:hypothetical protein
MTIDNELIDSLLKNYKKPEDLIGENWLLKQTDQVAQDNDSKSFDKIQARFYFQWSPPISR